MTSSEHDETTDGPTREPRPNHESSRAANENSGESIDDSLDNPYVTDRPPPGIPFLPREPQPGALPPGPAFKASARHDAAQSPPQYGTPNGTPPPGPSFAHGSRKSVAASLGPAPDLRESPLRRLLHRFGRRR
ncbi:MAG TPA: hypothetical protein VFU74_20190 [Actinocrinis sp.]|nr:hypothetical protein [Actinocrinis sp.]